MAEKSLTSAHELVYAIAYLLVGISVIVNKTKSGLKRRDCSTDKKKRSSTVSRFLWKPYLDPVSTMTIPESSAPRLKQKQVRLGFRKS